MTPFKNQERMLLGLTTELQALDHPKSWNVVIPPGFYEGQFGELLSTTLRRQIPTANVALVAADGVSSPSDLVSQIHYQWLGRIPESGEADVAPSTLLAQLLDTVGVEKNILIISEFHKILSAMDERVLVALRTAEQAGRIHTIAISMYPHKWLREKWKKEGHLLNVSNYGDHKQLDVEAYSAADIIPVLIGKGVPAALATMMYEWTGGIPEALDRTLDFWVEAGRPDPKPSVQVSLRRAAGEALARFVRCIDPEDSARFSQLITAIHQHSDESESLEQVSKFHPWSHILLDDDGLRADAIGDALTCAQLEKAFRSGTLAANISAVADIAVRYYRLGQYDLAIQAIRRCRETYDSVRLHLIELHAKIMEGLRGGVSSSPCPDADTEWGSVVRHIAEARKVLPDVLKEEHVRVLMAERYDQIERLSTIAEKAKRGGTRILDRLGGLLSAECDREGVFALVVYQYESGRSIRGNTAASKSVIELPEQIIRLWGYWKHDLNYYSCRPISPETWAAILDVWPKHLDPPTPPREGNEFPSLYLFCYCLYALELRTPQHDIRIWPSTKELQQELAVLDTRNDTTHATVHINAKIRKKLFDFIDTWLERLERDCMGSTSRNSVLSKVAPLEVF